MTQTALTVDHASPAVSNRYAFINTGDVIDILQQEGYVVASTKISGTRTRDPLYVRHQVDFRFPQAEKVHGAEPRYLFNNSHNGETRARLMLGVYRFVCSNGMVVGNTYASASVRHTGNLAKELIERIRALARNTTPLFQQIEKWSHVDLQAEERLSLAQQALVLRFGEDGAKRYNPWDLLQVRRDEDDRGDLWTVFNRIQENATHGGLVGHNTSGRRITSRGLQSIEADTGFNIKLWQAAAEFAGAK